MGRGKQGIAKLIADSKFGWDVLMGPIYNRYVMKAIPELYTDLVEQLCPPDNSRVLDVGSGPGHASVLLAERYPSVSVTGIDFSSTQIRASNKLRDRHGVNNCGFIEGNAMDLPFNDATFDIVQSIFCIKYWPDTERGLREIRRVLVPDGRALILELNKDFTEEEFEFSMAAVNSVLPWYLSAQIPQWFGSRLGRQVLFEKGISMDEAHLLAGSAGFEEISVEKVAGGLPFFLIELRS